MQSRGKADRLKLKDGLIVCPVCRQKTNQVVREDTTARNLVLWCRNCKAVHLVDIEFGQCFLISRCR
ncbi:MAG: hypothetical protein HFF31_05535 [Flavonifractor sp.]|nr:hypothetical protein [Flavonifractor sp.]